MKPEDIIGATIFDAVGHEGYGCRRCGVEPGQLELTSLCLKLASGQYLTLALDEVCPPDADTGRRETKMVSVGIVSSPEELL